MIETIDSLIRKLEKDYTSGPKRISKYVDFDQHENINKIEAYLNSKHISGSTDSLGREKPFFNIVTAAVNIWYRATDLDRKNVKIKATKESDRVAAFVATMYLQHWMRKNNFGQFLNNWGRTLAQYGSAVCKFVEKEGELIPSIEPWNTIICDSLDFYANPVIKVLELTPAQLRAKKGYNQEVIKGLLDTISAREDINKNKKDSKTGYIKVYEIHGELSESYLTDKEGDEENFVQQVQVVSFVESKEKKGEHEKFVLARSREKNPYLITHLIEEDNRTLSIGAVEHLFESQWMVNHSQKLIKDTLDFASLLILQTSDSNLTGRNVLNSLITGDILVHAPNEPLTQANTNHDVTQIMNFSSAWQSIAKETTATPDAIRGNTQPSGTAYRLQQLITDEAHSLFEQMTENKGLYLEEMLREFILPFIKKKLNNSEQISASLNSHGILQFDSMYIPNEVARRNNKKIKETVLNGEIAYAPDKQELYKEVQQELSQLGNQRFIKPSDLSDKEWVEVFKDLEWEVEVEITNESSDKNAILTTLSTVLQNIASNPTLLENPDTRLIFNRILEESGAISPLELSQIKQTSLQPTANVEQNKTINAVNNQ